MNGKNRDLAILFNAGVHTMFFFFGNFTCGEFFDYKVENTVKQRIRPNGTMDFLVDVCPRPFFTTFETIGRCLFLSVNRATAGV